jgi:hypothetical protein
VVRTLAPLAAAGADAGQVADSSIAVWRAVDAALAPVVGARGSAALLLRSLHLARPAYPWLAAACDSTNPTVDFDALRAALGQQTAATAAAAHDAILHTFHDLLADLIGRSLTGRLLQSVWEPPSSGNAARDASS